MTQYKDILLSTSSDTALLLFCSPSFFAQWFIFNFVPRFSCLLINHVLFWEPELQCTDEGFMTLVFSRCFCKKENNNKLLGHFFIRSIWPKALCIISIFHIGWRLTTHCSTQPLEIISSSVAPAVTFILKFWSSFEKQSQPNCTVLFLLSLAYVTVSSFTLYTLQMSLKLLHLQLHGNEYGSCK